VLVHSNGLPTVTRVQWWGTMVLGHLEMTNQNNKTKQNKGCVTFVCLAIHISKYLKAKEEELWKLKYFHHAKI